MRNTPIPPIRPDEVEPVALSANSSLSPGITSLSSPSPPHPRFALLQAARTGDGGHGRARHSTARGSGGHGRPGAALLPAPPCSRPGAAAPRPGQAQPSPCSSVLAEAWRSALLLVPLQAIRLINCYVRLINSMLHLVPFYSFSNQPNKKMEQNEM
jgi:hypothetical protein